MEGWFAHEIIMKKMIADSCARIDHREEKTKRGGSRVREGIVSSGRGQARAALEWCVQAFVLFVKASFAAAIGPLVD